MANLKESRFFDDPDYSGTIRYSRAVSVLRHCREALAQTLYAWDLFASLDPQCFAVDDHNLHTSSSIEMSTIQQAVSELRFSARGLSQRIETFDRMKDDVGTTPHLC